MLLLWCCVAVTMEAEYLGTFALAEQQLGQPPPPPPPASPTPPLLHEPDIQGADLENEKGGLVLRACHRDHAHFDAVTS
jgi:hypothetical protein